MSDLPGLFSASGEADLTIPGLKVDQLLYRIVGKSGSYLAR
jgi:hypothetical protein